jgi:hypothetical protein
MKSKVLILTVALASLLAAAGGMAAPDDGVARPREVLSGGASDAAGVGVTLRGTLGQPAVGVLSDGEVALGQGFWHGALAGHAVYLPLVLR